MTEERCPGCGTKALKLHRVPDSGPLEVCYRCLTLCKDANHLAWVKRRAEADWHDRG